MKRLAPLSVLLFSLLLFLCSDAPLLARKVVISACIQDSAGVERYSAYSSTGTLLFPFEYTWIWRMDLGYLVAITEKGSLVFKPSGQPFIQDTIDRIVDGEYEENRIAVQKKGKWGFYDLSGKLIIKFKYTEVSNFLNGYAKCKLKGKTIFIDTNGTQVKKSKVRSNEYDFIEEPMSVLGFTAPFKNDSLETVEQDGLYGIKDMEGTWRIPPLYDYFGESFDDKILAKLKGKWGMLDFTGKVIIPCEHYSLQVLW